MDAMKRLFWMSAQVAAAVVFVGVASIPAHAAAGPPAWTVRYDYAAGLFGGTNADFDADGHFRIVTASRATAGLANRRFETSGRLPHDELDALAASVTSAHPELWSSSYPLMCPDYIVHFALERRDARGDASTTKTGWGCRLAGLPADLRTLLDAVRGNVRARVPIAILDTDVALSGVAPPWPLVLSDTTGASTGAIRRITIDSDGKIVSRERTSTTLFAAKPCPQRDLGSVAALPLARMHAMLVPYGDDGYAMSSDTTATFNAAMSDCPRPAEWLDSNDFVIPNDAHWAVQFLLQRGDRNATIEIDSLGRADGYIDPFARERRRVDVPVAVDAATVAALGKLVATVRENGWSPRLLGTDANCVNTLRLARFYNGQSTQAQTSVSCNNPGAPADIEALLSLLTGRFGAYAGSAAAPP
jgi:hypothetical protein